MAAPQHPGSRPRPSSRSVATALLTWFLVILFGTFAYHQVTNLCQTPTGAKLDRFVTLHAGRSFCTTSSLLADESKPTAADATSVVASILDAPAANLSTAVRSGPFLSGLRDVLAQGRKKADEADDGKGGEKTKEEEEEEAMMEEFNKLVNDGLVALQTLRTLGPDYEHSSHSAREALQQSTALQPLTQPPSSGSLNSLLAKAKRFVSALTLPRLIQDHLLRPLQAWLPIPTLRKKAVTDLRLMTKTHLALTTRTTETLVELAVALGGSYMLLTMETERLEALCRELMTGLESERARRFVCEKEVAPLCCKAVGGWEGELRGLTMEVEGLCDEVEVEKGRWERLDGSLEGGGEKGKDGGVEGDGAGDEEGSEGVREEL